MPNKSFKGAQRIVYLSPTLDLAVRAYLERHQEMTFSTWIRHLIQDCLEKDAQGPGAARTSAPDEGGASEGDRAS